MVFAVWLALFWICDVAGWLSMACRVKGPLLLQGLTLISAWIGIYIHYKVWDEIVYPFLNFNGEMWEEITDQFLNFKGCIVEV